MMFIMAKKNETQCHVQLFRSMHFGEMKETMRGYLATRKKLQSLTEVKENHVMVNCICDQILSEKICRNINHRS